MDVSFRRVKAVGIHYEYVISSLIETERQYYYGHVGDSKDEKSALSLLVGMRLLFLSVKQDKISKDAEVHV